MKIFTVKTCALGALCLTMLALGFANSARADEIARATTTQPMPRTLIDRDANRSIEIVTDRHESISQFFQRQKVMIAHAPLTNRNVIPSANDLLKLTQPTKVFVSYPLENDRGLTIFRYGANLLLAPPNAAVQELFSDNAKLSSRQTLLIFVATTSDSAENKVDNNDVPVRLVGRIRVIEGAFWSPESEADTFKYQPAQAAQNDNS